MAVLRCIISDFHDPYLNLSAEEYFLKNSEDEFFTVYINAPSVVVGKHQNLLKEINAPWIYEHNITLCRRLSGGGTVYQDWGNLNFSFILNCPNLEKVNYKRFTQPILESLKHFSIDARNSERNDLLLEGFKISGNAMHIFKNRVLCHGTLLFNSKLDYLSLALKNNPDRYIDKSIKSVSSKVTNISPYLSREISMNDFTDQLFNKTLEFLNNPVRSGYLDLEVKEITHLARAKYSTWDWIYGYSPKYTFSSQFQVNGESIYLNLIVEKGIIKDIVYPQYNRCHVFDALINIRHDYTSLSEFFVKENLSEQMPSLKQKEFCNNLL